jgi:hypothetical protein
MALHMALMLPPPISATALLFIYKADLRGFNDVES